MNDESNAAQVIYFPITQSKSQYPATVASLHGGKNQARKFKKKREEFERQ